MNFFNKYLNYVDLEVDCLGLLEIDYFEELVMDIAEIGYTYRFTVAHNGNILTKSGIPFDSILFNMRDNRHLDLGNVAIDLYNGITTVLGPSSDRKLSEYYIKEVVNSAFVQGTDSFMILSLSGSIEKMIRESDYFKSIYLDKGVTPEQVSEDESLYFYLENLSLVYFKSSV